MYPVTESFRKIFGTAMVIRVVRRWERSWATLHASRASLWSSSSAVVVVWVANHDPQFHPTPEGFVVSVHVGALGWRVKKDEWYGR